MDYRLTSNDALTKLARSYGLDTWNKLTNYIQNIPYGRNENRGDFASVLTENKGTCSSKHVLLKRIADFNKIRDVKLIVAIYKMNNLNTPQIGSILTDNYIDWLPEAHCYLHLKNERFDFTFEKSSIHSIEKDILSETIFEPQEVLNYKVDYHKDFILKWLNENSNFMTFDKIWEIREKCIESISNNYLQSKR